MDRSIDQSQMTTETDSLLAGKIQTQIHKSTIEGTFTTFKTSKKGLSSEEAKEKRRIYGLNIIPPPLSAPEWLCCLLPCLLKTPSMMAFHEYVPQHGFVKRNEKWVKLDRDSIVPGDIIKICHGERAPADIRAIEVSGGTPCEFDSSTLTGSKSRKLRVDPLFSTDVYTESPNMIFLSYLCTAGEVTGVAVATGNDTLISKLIRRKEWPLAHI